MRQDDVLDDRQPQARPPLLAAAGLVDAVESLEQPRQVLRGDAAALVLDANDHLALFPRLQTAHMGSGRQLQHQVLHRRDHHLRPDLGCLERGRETCRTRTHDRDLNFSHLWIFSPIPAVAGTEKG